mgnify:CR=1 FL=1
MERLIKDLLHALPAAFESDDYRSQMRAIEEETEKAVEERWKSLETEAAREGIGVLQTPTGYVLAPVRDGKVIGDKEFEKLPEDEQETIQKQIKRLAFVRGINPADLPKLSALVG